MATTSREIRFLAHLAWPIVLTNLGTMLMATIDTLMVGRVGKEALAAAVLANAWTGGTMLFAMGAVHGIDPIVSQAHGAGDRRRAGLALQRGIVVGLFVGVLLGLLWGCTDVFLLWTGQDPLIVRQSHRYALAQIPTLPLFMAFVALRQYLQCRGILWPSLAAIVAANAVNVLLNWVLIFGKLGFPALGLFGAGIATAVTRVVMLAALLAIVRAARIDADGRVPWSRAALELRGIGEVLRFGAPTAVQMGLEVWAFAAASLMAGRLGATAAAAHGVVLNMASLSFMVPLGISFAAVTRVGNLIGAGRRREAQHAAWVAFGMGAFAMGVAALAFALLRRELPHLYTSELEVVALCAVVLPIAAAFQVFDGLQVVGCGILRGMGQTLPAAGFNLVGYWILALPLAWWMAFERGIGLAGVWWGLALGLSLVAVALLVWVRFRGPDGSRIPGVSGVSGAPADAG